MNDGIIGMLWFGDFLGITWQTPPGKIVVVPLFIKLDDAERVAKEVEEWNKNFTHLTFIERDNGEYSFVCFQDPKISNSKLNLGLYRSSMQQSGGYSKIKLILEKKDTMFNPREIYVQIVYADDQNDPTTYRHLTDEIKITKFNIINEEQLKSQEFNLEKMAHEESGGYKI